MIKKICLICKKEFLSHPSDKRRFCSKQCSYAFIRNLKFKLNCKICGIEIIGENSQKKFCNECKRINKNIYMKEYNRRPSVMIDRKNKRHQYYLDNKDRIDKKNMEYHYKNRDKILKKNREYSKKFSFEYNRRPEVRKHKKEYNKNYREKNRDRLIKQRKEYQQNNKERLNQSSREYKLNHREEIKKQTKEYRATKKHKEQRNKYRRKREKEDKQYNIRHRLRSRLNCAFITYRKTGKVPLSRQYNIDYKAIIEYLKPFPEDLSKYHIDHKIPLCSFDLINPEEVKKAFAPENHQWLLAEENMSKHKKNEISA